MVSRSDNAFSPSRFGGRHPLEQIAGPSLAVTRTQLRIHRCLCALVLTLLFEGIVRKLAPAALGIGIFFLKDVIALALLFLCLPARRNAEATRWLRIMSVVLGLLSPCILWTAIRDPLLAVFGAKQYALFPIVAVAMCVAYLPNRFREFLTIFKLMAASLVVTTIVAIAQNRLPAGHWLNMSVGGEDLEGFSAGGYLRVSSTFPFVGQYCYYLNALCFCLPVLFCLQKARRKWMRTLLLIVLIGLAATGTFITGSRGSVIGNLAILSVGGVLAVILGRTKGAGQVIVALVVGAVLLGVLRTQHPEFFAAYETRVEGTSESSHLVEITKRVQSGLLDWTSGWDDAPPSLLGYGLGVMSNGSEKLSSYAAGWRNSGFWTETDQGTTFFEGGWYLVAIWYGFRFWVILETLLMVLKLRSSDARIAAGFAWGFILVIGVTGTLAIQPPLAIWWWLAVGLILCLRRLEKERVAEARNFTLLHNDRYF